MLPWLNRDTPFPPLDFAMEEPNGLLAVGGDLSPARLLDAYHRGIFPWYSAGDPILWWSPNPRMVLYPAELRVTRSLDKVLRNRSYEVRFDSAFDEVIDTPRALRPSCEVEDDNTQVIAAGDCLQLLVQLEAHHDAQVIERLVRVNQGGTYVLQLFSCK